jgi:hypothetical protein
MTQKRGQNMTIFGSFFDPFLGHFWVIQKPRKTEKFFDKTDTGFDTRRASGRGFVKKT